MKRLIFALAAVMTFFAGQVAAGVKYVAVVETEIDAQSGAAAKLNKAEARQITAALRREAVNNLPRGKYNIMTSETVQAQGGAVLEECAEENCVITLGSKIGADYIVRGLISKIGANFTVTVEMYETEDGTLVASSDLASAPNPADLLDKAAAACAKMYKKFESEVAAVSAQKATAQQTTPQTAPPPPQPTVAVQQPTYQPPVSATTSTPTPRPTPTLTPTPAHAPAYPKSVVDASGVLTDGRDGRTYKTVVIGGKRWMAENLNYQPQNGKSSCYKNDNSNCGKYGRLYDWNTAKTVCPAGFHLPSRQEWNDLVKVAGGVRKAGKKLKAISGWKNNGSGTDDYGWSAMPGGYSRFNDGGFFNVGYDGYWWTAAEYYSEGAYLRYMDHFYDGVGEGNYDKSGGRSVRCVADN